MKRITFLPRIAAVGLLFGALAAGIPAFTAIKNAVGAPSNPVTQGPLGLIETDGTLDSPFNASGKFTNGLVLASALQTDGKLLIAGQFSEVHGVTRNNIARLNTDGTLDLSFDSSVGADAGVGNVALQPDGKILIANFFHTVNGVNRQASLARLNSDGSLDASFDPGRGISFDGVDDGTGAATFPGFVYELILQPDGKVVVMGQFFFVITGPGANVARSCIARFNSDGTFDATFNPGVGAGLSGNPSNAFVFHGARQSLGANAGKIVIAGFFDTFDGHPVSNLARLNANGSFDVTFTPGSGTDASVNGLFVQADDQIVLFGLFDSFSGVTRDDIVRLNASSGIVDSGFTTEEFKEYGSYAQIFAVAQQPNGKLIVTGDFHSLGSATANNAVRLETNGSRDASFSGTGAGPSAWQINTALVRPSDGKVFLGGYFTNFGGEVRYNLAWANSDGSVDSSFAGLAGASEYAPNVWALATQSDGKVVVTGLFTSFDGTPHNNVLRVNSDGTLDSSFDVQTDRSTRALLVQPDGKIVIAGNFGEVNGVPMARIARLSSDGTLDPSFDPGTGPDNYIYALAQDSDGNTYAGGLFATFNGVQRPGVAKLNSNGALDTTFNPGGGDKDNPFIYAIAPPDSKGRIVIGGQFGTFTDIIAHGIARLDGSTGALDPTFMAGQGFGGTVFALRLAPDGKYYAGGAFSSFNGATRRRVARLNGDGSLDNTFVGPAISGTVYSLALQNGKVYAGGTTPSGPLVRLTESGALDPSFVTGTGFEIFPADRYHGFTIKISTLGIQSDGKLLVGGIFNRYNGTARSCLARLTGPIVSPSPTPTPPASPTPSATPTPTASPTATPSATPSTILANVSTRLRVETGDNAVIGGFIVTGTQDKRVAVRGLGPSLVNSGITGVLADPTLELRDASGVLLIQNDDWQDTPIEEQLSPLGLALPNDHESGFVVTLPPGAYTAILAGKNGGTGVGLVEVYDVDRTVDSKLANISTRGLVQTGDRVMIAGTIVLGQASQRVLVRAIGPSLTVPSKLADPTLELRDGNGTLIRANDNWRSDQETEIVGTGIPPEDDLESALIETLPANGAAYTAIVSGVNDTSGVALVEIYGLTN